MAAADVSLTPLTDLPPSAGVYSGTTADWTHALVPFFDVPVALALLGWIIALLLWRARPSSSHSLAWSWLPGVAVSE